MTEIKQEIDQYGRLIKVEPQGGPFEQVAKGTQDNSLSEHVVKPEECQPEDVPVIDIHISNVVSTFCTRCHLNLKDIAMRGMNVIYKRETGMVSMKLREPSVTASIWASGKITCTGSTSEDEAFIAAKKVARCLWRLGFDIKMCKYKVVNVLGVCYLPFAIDLNAFTRAHPNHCSYEPELHPGATFRIEEIKATVKVFAPGSLTITAPSVESIQRAVEIVYHLSSNFQPGMHPESQLDESIICRDISALSESKKRHSSGDENVSKKFKLDDCSDSKIFN